MSPCIHYSVCHNSWTTSLSVQRLACYARCKLVCKSLFPPLAAYTISSSTWGRSQKSLWDCDMSYTAQLWHRIQLIERTILQITVWGRGGDLSLTAQVRKLRNRSILPSQKLPNEIMSWLRSTYPNLCWAVSQIWHSIVMLINPNSWWPVDTHHSSRNSVILASGPWEDLQGPVMKQTRIVKAHIHDYFDQKVKVPTHSNGIFLPFSIWP